MPGQLIVTQKKRSVPGLHVFFSWCRSTCPLVPHTSKFSSAEVSAKSCCAVMMQCNIDDAMIQIQSSTIKPQCPHRRLGYDLVALACSQTRLHSKRASLSVRSPKLRFLNTLQYGIGKETGNHCSPPNIGGERIRWNTSKNVSKVKGNGFKLLTSIDKLVPQLEVVKKM